tara:strand:- start:313 stop:981 length:669 start_codon:yes stop_codon:yes gene_type:complete
MCPEAPVPVFNPIDIVENGGMAMNVYNNLIKMGAQVDIITNENYEGIKKTRFIDHRTNHMFMRLDEKDNDYGKFLINDINFDEYEAVIISDYDKGFLTKKDIETIGKSHKAVFLDTKKTLGKWCETVSFIKFNITEYERSKPYVNKKISKKLIVTLGPKGAVHRDVIYPVPKVEIKDTSGAGDTFVAALASEYIKNCNIESAIVYANSCSTTVVQRRGVATV